MRAISLQMALLSCCMTGLQGRHRTQDGVHQLCFAGLRLNCQLQGMPRGEFLDIALQS